MASTDGRPSEGVFESRRLKAMLTKFANWHWKPVELMKTIIDEGCAPCTSFKIQIHGDKDVGKTSLSKKLRGARFDENERETIGIEKKTCQVSHVDGVDWHDIKELDYNEFETIAAWLLRTKLSETKPTSTLTYRDTFNIALLMFFIGVFLFFLQRYFNTPFAFYTLTLITLIIVLVSKKTLVLRWGLANAKYPFIFLIAESLTVTFGCPEECLSNQLCASEVNCTFRTCLAYILTTWAYNIINEDILLHKLSTILLLTFLPCEDHDGGNLFFTDSKFSLVSQLPLLPAYLIYPSFFIGLALSKVNLENIKHRFIFGFKLTTNKTRFAWHVFLQIVLCLSAFYVPFYVKPILFGTTIGLNVAYSTDLQSQFNLKVFEKARNHFVFAVFSVLLLLFAKDMHVPLFICVRCVNFKTLPLSDIICLLRVSCALLFILVETEHFVSVQKHFSSVSDNRKTLINGDLNVLPLKLSLLDFAGQNFYYDTHHSFMATRAIYVLVFDITSFLTEADCIFVTERIRFWLNSIRLHTKGPIILVGTHLDQVYDHSVLSTVQNHIEPVLQYFNEKYGCHFYYNGKCPYFCIDSSSRAKGVDDFVKLKVAIHAAVQAIQVEIEHYPVRWRQFVTFVHQTRQMVSKKLLPTSALVITVSQIHGQVSDRLRSNEIEEMLKLLNDIGEIIYDTSDPILSQYVVLDPQFLVDVIQLLTSTPDKYDGYMSIYRKLLQNKGQLHNDLLKDTLRTKDDKLVKIIRDFLVAKHLIIYNDENMYTVPCKLPKFTTDVKGIPNANWNKKFYVDFSEQEPSIFVHRLIARLSRHPYTPYAKCSTMWRDGGIFTYYDHHLTFRLQTLHPCPGQHMVEVAVKVAPGSLKRPIDFFRDLLTTMRCIQQREFPRMWFIFGVLCPHPPPHDQEALEDVDAVHILKLASEITLLSKEDIIYTLCKARDITVDLNEVLIKI